MLSYFQYEEILECSTETLFKSNRPYIIASQPHGVVSYCGICGKIAAPPQLQHVPTAVASVLLKTPILKNVMGIFGFIDASSSSLKKHFKESNKKNSENIANRSVVLYAGGIAELFKSSRKEERLYLSQRKGFIKLALRENVDVIPVYLFGNTSVLTVVKTGLLADLSRRLGASLTYFWGKYYLPIPRDDKCLYVRGLPLNLPCIPNPTDDDVSKWHAIYCDEVRRLFDKYKALVPLYKDKTLFID
jgi:2-acylglycerol O-acyltransferase 2